MKIKIFIFLNLLFNIASHLNCEVIHRFTLGAKVFCIDLSDNGSNFFKVDIYKEDDKKYIGNINFEIRSEKKCAYIARFQIDQNYRRSFIGSYVFKYICEYIFNNIEIDEINLNAIPFDLAQNETRMQMWPKLIKFYKEHGFHISEKRSSLDYSLTRTRESLVSKL